MQSLLPRVKELEVLVEGTRGYAKRIGAELTAQVLQLLLLKIRHPQVYVSVVGRTSSGKTSIINGMLGREQLPHSADPTTAVVAEVRNSEDGKSRLLRVNHDGVSREISLPEFALACREIDKDLRRLVVEEERLPFGMEARIFDTPGYDSVFDAHGQVLSTFIPEADILVFTVFYRAGLVQSDLAFLDEIREVFGDSLPPLVLVINRAPTLDKTDRRVVEIQQGVAKRITQPFKTFIVLDTFGEGLPSETELWRHVGHMAQDPKRIRELYLRYGLVFQSSLGMIRDYLDTLELVKQASKEEISKLCKTVEDYKAKKEKAYHLLDKGREEISYRAKEAIEDAAAKIIHHCEEVIDDANSFTKSLDCGNFIANELVQVEAERAIKEVSKLVYRELGVLNKQLEDMVITAIGIYHQEISSVLDKYEKMKTEIVGWVGKRGLEYVAMEFFVRLGGRGGYKAGVTNFAKMALKRIGNVMNVKFKLQVYNNLARFIAKIGANTAAAITLAVSLIIEGALYLFRVATWKGKLKKNVNQAVANWKKQVSKQVQEEVQQAIEETRQLVTEKMDQVVCDLEDALQSMEKEKAPSFTDMERFEREYEQIVGFARKLQREMEENLA